MARYKRGAKILVCLLGGMLLQYVIYQLLTFHSIVAINRSMAMFPNGIPGDLQVVIRGPDGKGREGISVYAEDTSAGRRATTDATGRAYFGRGEQFILAVWAEKKGVAQSYFFRIMDTTNGLEMFVILD